MKLEQSNGSCYRSISRLRYCLTMFSYPGDLNSYDGQHFNWNCLMPSQSYANLEIRLQDVQQLLEAHEALTRLRKAEASLQNGGQELGNIANVILHLVSEPGRGRRQEVHALNNAGIALLSGHLQGYIHDIYREAADLLLANQIQDIDALTGAAHSRGNPNPDNIKKLFGSLGFTDVFDKISWQGMSSESLKRKLREFNTLRNQIVHGVDKKVKKQTLTNYLAVFKNFSKKLDEKLCADIKNLTGKAPW